MARGHVGGNFHRHGLRLWGGGDDLRLMRATGSEAARRILSHREGDIISNALAQLSEMFGPSNS